MPRKPLKPCKVPYCPNLTSGMYCEVHSGLGKKSSSDYERHRRDPEHKKRYGSKWQKVRRRYISMHPYCEKCFQNGIFREVDEVHHIRPLVDGGTNEDDNLMSLCRSCHAKIHGDRRDRKHTVDIS